MADFANLQRWTRGENLEQEQTEITEGFASSQRSFPAVQQKLPGKIPDVD